MSANGTCSTGNLGPLLRDGFRAHHGLEHLLGDGRLGHEEGAGEHDLVRVLVLVPPLVERRALQERAGGQEDAVEGQLRPDLEPERFLARGFEGPVGGQHLRRVVHLRGRIGADGDPLLAVLLGDRAGQGEQSRARLDVLVDRGGDRAGREVVLHLLAELFLDLQRGGRVQALVRVALHDLPDPLGDLRRPLDGIEDRRVIAVLRVPVPRPGLRGAVAEHVALERHLGRCTRDGSPGGRDRKSTRPIIHEL